MCYIIIQNVDFVSRTLAGRLYPAMTEIERKILRRKKRVIASSLELTDRILNNFRNVDVITKAQLEEIQVSR